MSLHGASARLKRVAAIHRAVAAGEYPTQASLAARLGCSTREIKRDMRFMRDELHAPLRLRGSRAGSGFYYARRWSAARAVLRYLGFGD